MTPSIYQRAEQIIDRLREEPAGAHSQIIEQACGSDASLREEVESLVKHGALNAIDASQADPLGVEPTRRAADEGKPERVGLYRIVRRIGEGGMGTVYEGVQEKSGQTAAVKLVRPGLASANMLRRFEFELQVLARLDHPGIARIYYADTADFGHGRQPYFVMELVRGQNLTDYANTRRLNLRQRLELAAAVADAVQHAHQQGVIHRDLKPANIVVTADGQPKILDFGVARLTDDAHPGVTRETIMGQLVGTLPYMSPEQAAGDANGIDTRSDIYSLGVVMYELLTGRLPYPVLDMPLHEIVRIIKEVAPSRLSAATQGPPQPDDSSDTRPAGAGDAHLSGITARELRGDVETIVLKALEKDKSRRYPTANAVAQDIRRFLSNEPITARPPSATYQLGRFARRNKVLVGAVIGVFGVLMLAVLVSLRMYMRAEVQRVHADKQRFVAKRTEDFMALMLNGVTHAVARGRDTALLQDILEAMATRIESGQLKDTPEAELRLRWTIGLAYIDIGGSRAYDQAGRMLLPTLDLSEALAGSESEHAAISLSRTALYLQHFNQPAEALPRHESALRIFKRLHRQDHADLAMQLNNVASCLQSLNRPADALPLNEQALAMRMRLFKGDHPDVAMSLTNIAFCLKLLGRQNDAIAQFEASLLMKRRLFKGDHPDVATAMDDLARCMPIDRSGVALPLYEAALAMRRRLITGDHPHLAASLNNVAYCTNMLGQPVEALPNYKAALAMYQRLFDGHHAVVASALFSVADCLVTCEQPAEALAHFEAALQMRQRLHPGDHVEVANALNSVAYCLQLLDRPADALPINEQALAMRQRLFKGDHPDIATSLNNIAYCLKSLDRSSEALHEFEAALDMRQRVLRSDDPRVTAGMQQLAGYLILLDRPVEAVTWLQRRLQIDFARHANEHGNPRSNAELLSSAKALSDASALLNDHASKEQYTHLAMHVSHALLEQYSESTQELLQHAAAHAELLSTSASQHNPYVMYYLESYVFFVAYQLCTTIPYDSVLALRSQAYGVASVIATRCGLDGWALQYCCMQEDIETEQCAIDGNACAAAERKAVTYLDVAQCLADRFSIVDAVLAYRAAVDFINRTSEQCPGCGGMARMLTRALDGLAELHAVHTTEFSDKDNGRLINAGEACVSNGAADCHVLACLAGAYDRAAQMQSGDSGTVAALALYARAIQVIEGSISTREVEYRNYVDWYVGAYSCEVAELALECDAYNLAYAQAVQAQRRLRASGLLVNDINDTLVMARSSQVMAQCFREWNELDNVVYHCINGLLFLSSVSDDSADYDALLDLLSVEASVCRLLGEIQNSLGMAESEYWLRLALEAYYEVASNRPLAGCGCNIAAVHGELAMLAIRRVELSEAGNQLSLALLALRLLAPCGEDHPATAECAEELLVCAKLLCDELPAEETVYDMVKQCDLIARE